MTDPSPGIVVVGPLRSGTNMVAGIFARHGVFFGDCKPADALNRKGYFENRWLWKALDERPQPWPEVWFDRLALEGWTGEPWGAKCSPRGWRLLRETNPAVVIVCERPRERIEASRKRGLKATGNPLKGAVETGHIPSECEAPVVTVRTDELVRGGQRNKLAVAMDTLGLTLNERIVSRWIDPALWNGGRGA